MKKFKFTEAQIVFALRQAETGTKVAEVCRKMGISEATFYNWKKKYGGLGSSELRRLRQLEAENQQPGKLVADLSLDKHMLQDVIKKSYRASKAARARSVPGGGLPGLDQASLPRRESWPDLPSATSPDRARTRRSWPAYARSPSRGSATVTSASTRC